MNVYISGDKYYSSGRLKVHAWSEGAYYITVYGTNNVDLDHEQEFS